MDRIDSKYIVMLFIVSVGLVFAVTSLLQTNSISTTSTTTTTEPTTTTTSTTSSTTKTTSTTTTTTTETEPTAINTSTQPKATETEVSMKTSSDKELYHSGDILTLAINLNSSEPMPGAQLKVYGIKSGYYRINDTKKIDVSEGENSFSFTYKTPNCYGCSGIKPGRYNLTTELIYYGKVISKQTIEFEMRQ